MKLRNLFFGTAAVAAVAGLVLNAPSVVAQMGMFFGFPIVGQGAYCITSLNPAPPNANGNGASQATQCAAMAPAGPPSVTGNELLIAQTQLPGGQNPQSVYIQADSFFQRGQGSSRNVLIGSDFSTNLWQRGTTPLSAATPSTTTMSADRWGVYSSGNTVTVTKDVTAADVLPSAGLNGIMKVTRPSGTNTTSICVGQVMPVAESQRFIGNEAVFSFWAEALAGYLQTNSTIIATIAVYTAGDSATPGTNTDAFFKGTVTGYTVLNPVAGASTLASPVLSGTASTATIPLTTSLARYSVAAYVPPQVSISGTLTNVLGIGVTLCTGTYPASTGVSTDGFAFGNPMLEATSAGALGIQNGATVTVAQPVTTPGGYARPWVEWDQAQQLAYSYAFTDGTATLRYAAGFSSTNALAQFFLQFPVPMRETPTLTVGNSGVAMGVLHQTTSTACGTSFTQVASTSTTRGAGVLCTTGGTALTAGEGSLLVGANTSALVVFSAEP